MGLSVANLHQTFPQVCSAQRLINETVTKYTKVQTKSEIGRSNAVLYSTTRLETRKTKVQDRSFKSEYLSVEIEVKLCNVDRRFKQIFNFMLREQEMEVSKFAHTFCISLNYSIRSLLNSANY